MRVIITRPQAEAAPWLKALDAAARYALLSDVARLCIDEG